MNSIISGVIIITAVALLVLVYVVVYSIVDRILK
jgi:hypothetical protein